MNKTIAPVNAPEAHRDRRTPGQVCTSPLTLDLATMTATCPVCGATWGVMKLEELETTP